MQWHDSCCEAAIAQRPSDTVQLQVIERGRNETVAKWCIRVSDTETVSVDRTLRWLMLLGLSSNSLWIAHEMIYVRAHPQRLGINVSLSLAKSVSSRMNHISGTGFMRNRKNP